MAVTGVGGNPYGNQKAYKTPEGANLDKAAQVSNETSDVLDVVDSFVKSEKQNEGTAGVYKRDTAVIADLRAKDKAYIQNLQNLVSSLLNQTGASQKAQGANAWQAAQGGLDASKVDSYWDLLVDNGDGTYSFHPDLSPEAQDALIDKARQDISEDGYYGVKQTSQRILDFAKAVAGNDPAKIDEMRKMAQEAFDSVKEIMGGTLPDISQKTYEAVMAGFDAWAAEAKAG